MKTWECVYRYEDMGMCVGYEDMGMCVGYEDMGMCVGYEDMRMCVGMLAMLLVLKNQGMVYLGCLTMLLILTKISVDGLLIVELQAFIRCLQVLLHLTKT